MCSDSSQYQSINDLIIDEPSQLKSPHQITNLEYESGMSFDPTSDITPDVTDSESNDLLREAKIQKYLKCVGWEVSNFSIFNA